MLIIPLQPITIVLSILILLGVYVLARRRTDMGNGLFWLAWVLLVLVILQCTASLEELELSSLLTSFPCVLLILLPLPDSKAT